MKRKIWWVCFLVGSGLMLISGVSLAQSTSGTLVQAPHWLALAAGLAGTLIATMGSVTIAIVKVASKLSTRITSEMADLREHVTVKLGDLEKVLRSDLAPVHHVKSITERLTSMNQGLDKLHALDPPSIRECRDSHIKNDREHEEIRVRLTVLEHE